ncbi:MAG TPA: AMP-binding protein [Gammaproteobacteria bacterium]|nr:AMP-binding protein [Gammaproteobacteria bacterium]
MNRAFSTQIGRYRTLVDALSANQDSDRGIAFLEGEDTEQRVSYQSLYTQALSLLERLQGHGLGPGDQLVIFLNDNARFIEAFWACLLGGIIPVPVSPGVSDEHRFKLFRIFKTLERPYLYTAQETLARLMSFAGANNLGEIFARVKTNCVLSEPLTDLSKQGAAIDPNPDDIAFIQFSSGSTSEPKGVVLTHRNIITNIKAIIAGAWFTDDDVSLSWMPLTHDMGLVGFHLNMLVCNMVQYLMPTELFIRRPLLWLKAAAERRANILCSPNFGYKHFLKAFDSKGLDGIDLSHVRLIFNGAEPISVELCEEFLSKMARFGLARATMFPVYGLAEATLAVTFPACGEEYRAVHVDRNALEIGHEVRVIKSDARDAVGFAQVGRPIQNCFVRIADDAGRELPARTVGHVYIKGDNVTRGYYKNSEANRAAITSDGWLDTGDLGFISAGELVITGRAKDIIFVNGQNYYPHDLENIAQHIDGLELGKVVVSGFRKPNVQTDELLVFVLFRGRLEDFADVTTEVRRLINERAGVEVTHVIPVKRIPKTTSGKVQRHLLERQYAQGAYDEALTLLSGLHAKTHAKTEKDSTEVEQKLKQICDTALKDKRVGIHDSLFEIGTSSLALVEIHEGIEAAFPGLIDITDLFDYPTIAELAAHLEAKLREIS